MLNTNVAPSIKARRLWFFYRIVICVRGKAESSYTQFVKCERACWALLWGSRRTCLEATKLCWKIHFLKAAAGFNFEPV